MSNQTADYGDLTGRFAVQRTRGSSLQHETFAGLDGEITVNTDTKVVHVHDGDTLGGFPLDYEVNVKRFGALGNGVDDDTAAINAAIGAGSIIYFPAGTYLIKGTNSAGLDGVNITGSNKTLYGDHDATIIKQHSSSQYAVSINRYNGGTTDVADNVKNITIRNLKFLATDDFDEHRHLLNVNAVSELLVENCTFEGFRGDGLYIGSGNEPDIERHNERVTVVNCRFDGVNQQNRNGITIIDCDSALVDNCSFRNTTTSAMPGAIDVEPDADFNVTRDHGSELRVLQHWRRHRRGVFRLEAVKRRYAPEISCVE